MHVIPTGNIFGFKPVCSPGSDFAKGTDAIRVCACVPEFAHFGLASPNRQRVVDAINFFYFCPKIAMCFSSLPERSRRVPKEEGRIPGYLQSQPGDGDVPLNSHARRHV